MPSVPIPSILYSLCTVLFQRPLVCIAFHSAFINVGWIDACYVQVWLTNIVLAWTLIIIVFHCIVPACRYTPCVWGDIQCRIEGFIGTNPTNSTPLLVRACKGTCTCVLKPLTNFLSNNHCMHVYRPIVYLLRANSWRLHYISVHWKRTDGHWTIRRRSRDDFSKHWCSTVVCSFLLSLVFDCVFCLQSWQFETFFSLVCSSSMRFSIDMNRG